MPKANVTHSPTATDRRVPGAQDRRRWRTGGRRFTDHGWSFPPAALVTCEGCLTGTADLSAHKDARSTVTYCCRDCGHQFNRIAE
jgi:hypothetical protein